MLCIVLAAALAVANPSPTSAATVAPARASAPSGPLREIVFKIAESDTATGTASDYGGTDTGGSSGWDQGTMTVDVLQVLSGDVYQVQASEAWNSLGGKPYSAVGYVMPDGTLSIVSGTYSVAMTSVLPYLSSGFIASHDMVLGTTWTLSGDADKAHYEHKYSVTRIDGSNVTITVAGTITTGMGMFPTTEQDSVVYRPTKLVPISGDFTVRVRSSNGQADQTVTHNFHFERVSDTRDP